MSVAVSALPVNRVASHQPAETPPCGCCHPAEPPQRTIEEIRAIDEADTRRRVTARGHRDLYELFLAVKQARRLARRFLARHGERCPCYWCEDTWPNMHGRVRSALGTAVWVLGVVMVVLEGVGSFWPEAVEMMTESRE